jgi:serine/threonine protein kinase
VGLSQEPRCLPSWKSVTFLRSLNHALRDHIATLAPLCQKGFEQAPGPADLCFGSYRVIGQIGVGGMAVVFGAVHQMTGAIAAIKVLPIAGGASSVLRQRLYREATILQRIDHPRIVKLLEVGEVSSGLGGGCYIAMEYLPDSLLRVLSERPAKLLPVTRALRLARGIAEGLSIVHAAGLVHRDVKPSNIMLRQDGSPVLIDFSLTALVAEEALSSRLTPPNVLVGTAEYLAPEQIAGLPFDGRSDLYSLGVVLYEMLSGRTPFAGRVPFEVLLAHVGESPPLLPPTSPPAAVAVVNQALRKLPDDRFVSAGAMAQALSEAERAIRNGNNR